MKKLILTLTALLTMAVSASAMSYSQAREQALFLTDKMAYELNLTDDQYEAAFEINLDYLMGIDNYDDLYGTYWTRRNMDLSYILLDWQYRAFCNASYFYRPLYWDGGFWHFAIYARYPHRDYFYFGRPAFVAHYRGGHSWHNNGGQSWYRGREFGGRRGGEMTRMGMRDQFDRGDFGRGTREFGGRNGQPQRNVAQRNGQQNRTFGGRDNNMTTRTNGQNRVFGSRVNQQQNNMGNRQNNGSSTFGGRANTSTPRSSTRTTVERRGDEMYNQQGSSFGNRSNNNSYSRSNSSTPSRTFTPSNGSSSRQSAPSRSFGSSTRSSVGGSSMGSHSAGGSFGGGHATSGSRSGGGSFGGGHR